MPRSEVSEELDDFEWEILTGELDSWLYFRIQNDIWDQILEGVEQNPRWEILKRYVSPCLEIQSNVIPSLKKMCRFSGTQSLEKYRMKPGPSYAK